MAVPLDMTRSPLLQMLPQGQDKALKQAFYNTAANVFFLLVCLAAVAVYYILEVFLRPLVWAVLCGTCLFPIKRTLTTAVQNWLSTLHDSSTPLLVGSIFVPIKLVDNASESLGSFIRSRWKIIAFLLTLYGTIYLTVLYAPIEKTFLLCWSVFTFIYETLGYFSAKWVWTVVIGYVVIIFTWWSPASHVTLRVLSIPVWACLVLHLATIAGPLRVPLALVLSIMLVIGFVSQLSAAASASDSDSDILDDVDGATGHNTSWFESITSRFGLAHGEESEESAESAHAPESVESAHAPETLEKISEEPSDDRIITSDSAIAQGTRTLIAEVKATVQEITSPANTEPLKTQAKLPDSSKRPSNVSVAANTDYTDSAGHTAGRPNLADERHRRRSRSQGASGSKSKSLGDLYLAILLWALGVLHLVHHWWVLQLLPLLFIFLALKRLGVQLMTSQYVASHIHKCKQWLYAWDATHQRLSLLVPMAVRGVFSLLLSGDRKIVKGLSSYVDKLMSVLVVLMLIVGAAMTMTFTFFQVQRESLHLVSMASSLINTTFQSQQLGEWLPNADDLQKTVDSMVNNAYLYGRGWISDKMHSAFNGDEAYKDTVEQEVIQLWDHVYNTWFAKNATRVTIFNSTAISIGGLSDVWSMLQKARYNDLGLVPFLQENVGVALAVLESVWTLIKGNVSLLVRVFTVLLSVILGSGTALINLLIFPVIFTTTVFYLLVYSGDQYKPVEWFASLSPIQGRHGNTFAKAVEEAISSVFLATFKMSVFYGLYTWLTHTLFGIQIIFIPSVMAAIFAAVPFVGSYWAAMPAVLELWLVSRQAVLAGLLLTCHLLPTYFVDTAIYADIRGGHPFLTGLAVAGGVYWLGLEGAIIGPILLCCLLVAVNVYTLMLQPEDHSLFSPSTMTPPMNPRVHMLSRRMHRGLSVPES